MLDFRAPGLDERVRMECKKADEAKLRATYAAELHGGPDEPA